MHADRRSPSLLNFFKNLIQMGCHTGPVAAQQQQQFQQFQQGAAAAGVLTPVVRQIEWSIPGLNSCYLAV